MFKYIEHATKQKSGAVGIDVLGNGSYKFIRNDDAICWARSEQLMRDAKALAARMWPLLKCVHTLIQGQFSSCRFLITFLAIVILAPRMQPTLSKQGMLILC